MKDKIIDGIIAVAGVIVFIPLALVVIISMILDLMVAIFVEDGEE